MRDAMKPRLRWCVEMQAWACGVGAVMVAGRTPVEAYKRYVAWVTNG